jgi:NADH dehydrogenase
MLNAKQTQIVIIGAGYAGLFAAHRLAWKTRPSDVAITLVNGTQRFIERVNLHKFAAKQQIGQAKISANLRGTGVEFVQGWVESIQPCFRSRNPIFSLPATQPSRSKSLGSQCA